MSITAIHHTCMKCTPSDLSRVTSFYHDLLELPILRSWPEGIMFDTGAGVVEVFTNGDELLPKGIIRHVAFAVTDTDALAEKIAAAGYEVFLGPKDLVLPSEVPLHARIAFCRGPLGEEIELFQEVEDMEQNHGLRKLEQRGRYNEPSVDGKDVYHANEKLREHMKKIKE